MYDSEYFRKVIGSNYNPNELYNTTYDNNEGVNIRTIDAPLTQNTSFVNNTQMQTTHNTNFLNNTPVQTMSNEALANLYNNGEKEVFTEQYNNVNAEPVSQGTYNNVNTKPILQEPYTNVSTEPVLQQETYSVNSNNNKLIYPDIYNVINPMVDTVLKNRQNIEYNEATINAMSTEIYNALEVDVNPQKTAETNTFNNTIQVNARPKNYLLHDLIKIMLIGKIEKGQ